MSGRLLQILGSKIFFQGSTDARLATYVCPAPCRARRTEGKLDGAGKSRLSPDMRAQKRSPESSSCILWK